MCYVLPATQLAFRRCWYVDKPTSCPIAELVDLVQLDVLAAVVAAATTITGGAAMGCLSAQGMAWSAYP